MTKKSSPRPWELEDPDELIRDFVAARPDLKRPFAKFEKAFRRNPQSIPHMMVPERGLGIDMIMGLWFPCQGWMLEIVLDSDHFGTLTGIKPTILELWEIAEAAKKQARRDKRPPRTA